MAYLKNELLVIFYLLGKAPSLISVASTFATFVVRVRKSLIARSF